MVAANQFDVAVIGTGIVGMAAALGFAQQGVSAALAGPPANPPSPEPGRTFDARIYAVAPASVALLERLGVWANIDPQRTCPVLHMRVFGDAGDELSFDAYGAAVERLATIVEEREMQRALDAACRFQPAINRVTSQFASMQIHPDQAEVELDNRRALSIQLVVGADGGSSPVRAAAGISASVKSYEQTALVANFSCDRPHLNTAWQWFTDEGVVALLPLPGDHVSLVWSAPQALAAELVVLKPDQLAARVAQRTGGALGTLILIGKAHAFPLRRLIAARIVAARIALVGDAAHVIHPLAGQGLNLGLQDVAMLLDVVREREAFRDIGDEVLLRRYERGRAEAVGLMRFTTDSLARLFGFDDPLARQLRNFGLTAVNRLSPLKNALIRQALG